MTATPNDVLWDRQLPVSRDRSVRLTRDEVAAAAFAIAEAETLTAVSVKRVAGRLGIPGVRLQHVLHDRADLLDLMVEVGLGEIGDTGSATADWPVQLWHLAHRVRDTARRHPWLGGLLGLRAPTGPNGLRFTERTLQTMTSAGVDIATAAQCVETVLAFVCGIVRPEALAASAGTQPQADVADYLSRQVTAQTYPLVSQLLAAGSAVTSDEVFDIGLSHLLTGMAGGLNGADSDLRAMIRADQDSGSPA